MAAENRTASASRAHMRGAARQTGGRGIGDALDPAYVQRINVETIRLQTNNHTD